MSNQKTNGSNGTNGNLPKGFPEKIEYWDLHALRYKQATFAEVKKPKGEDYEIPFYRVEGKGNRTFPFSHIMTERLVGEVTRRNHEDGILERRNAAAI